MNIVNLTPHPIHVHLADGSIQRYDAADTPARLDVSTKPSTPIRNQGRPIPVADAQYGSVSGLPAPQGATIFVVSLPVAIALQGRRSDVFACGEAVRDPDGNPVGCRGLYRVLGT